MNFIIEGLYDKPKCLRVSTETMEDIFFMNRFGVGTYPKDIRIKKDLKGDDSDRYTLSIQEFSDILLYTGARCDFKSINADLHMYTLLGINFIQNNGAINANNFDNLTQSLCTSRSITYELLLILHLAIENNLLSPKTRWQRILFECNKDECKIL